MDIIFMYSILLGSGWEDFLRFNTCLIYSYLVTSKNLLVHPYKKTIISKSKLMSFQGFRNTYLWVILAIQSKCYKTIRESFSNALSMVLEPFRYHQAKDGAWFDIRRTQRFKRLYRNGTEKWNRRHDCPKQSSQGGDLKRGYFRLHILWQRTLKKLKHFEHKQLKVCCNTPLLFFHTRF